MGADVPYQAAATVKCHFSEIRVARFWKKPLSEEDMTYLLELAHSDLRQETDRVNRMYAESMTCIIRGRLFLQKDAPYLVKRAVKVAVRKRADVFSVNYCMYNLSDFLHKIIPLVFTKRTPPSLQEDVTYLFKLAKLTACFTCQSRFQNGTPGLTR